MTRTHLRPIRRSGGIVIFAALAFAAACSVESDPFAPQVELPASWQEDPNLFDLDAAHEGHLPVVGRDGADAAGGDAAELQLPASDREGLVDLDVDLRRVRR